MSPRGMLSALFARPLRDGNGDWVKLGGHPSMWPPFLAPEGLLADIIGSGNLSSAPFFTPPPPPSYPPFLFTASVGGFVLIRRADGKNGMVASHTNTVLVS